MNAVGHVQNKWRVTLTLHWTNRVHTSVNARKMKFISYMYTLFLYRFCSSFMQFGCKSCKISDEEKFWKDVFGSMTTFNSRLHDMMSVESRPFNYFIYPWRRKRKTPRRVKECRSSTYESRRSKIGASKEVVDECKHFGMYHFMHAKYSYTRNV